ncbi:MAG: GTPase ObgE [Oscillospiraceae bacterium]|nr:GTPase ObgE [Oscillospiraceae bacterium]
MFVDKATIKIKAGNGGNGAVAFHREKYVPAGGPVGGDGGRGGDVILQVDDHMSTLMDFRYKRKYAAGVGMDGGGKRCSGKDGEDLIIRVPRGTIVRDEVTKAIMRDMSSGEPFIVAKGGRGGWGNQHFATPTRQTPRFAKSGIPGEERSIILELKLLADVGLVGFPNVGKSTMLSVMSRARPKIANYHFTTLFPNLGVVFARDDVSFVLADIPGLIEGAADGAGLGHDFLRHVDRCRLIVHVVDVSGSEGREPLADFEAINAELAAYSPELASRPQIVVANKLDIVQDDTLLETFRAEMAARGLPFLALSAATHQGIGDLISLVAEKLQGLPPISVYEPEFVPPEAKPATPEELTIRVVDGDTWVVEGAWLDQLLGRVNLDDYESRMYFERNLEQAGVYARLEEMGIAEGDTVCMDRLEFEYRK